MEVPIDLQEISILNIMPQNIARDPNVIMMAAAFDEELRSFVSQIPNVAIMKRLVLREIIDHALLDMLAWQWHVDIYDTSWSTAMKQDAIFNSLDWHRRKGTTKVVEEVARWYFGDAEVTQWFEGLPYPAGVPRNAYTFMISTSLQDVSEDAVKSVYDIIKRVKNTRSWMAALQIIREVAYTVYHACGLVQIITTIIEMEKEKTTIDKAPWYYAAFIMQRRRIVIGGTA